MGFIISLKEAKVSVHTECVCVSCPVSAVRALEVPSAVVRDSVQYTEEVECNRLVCLAL